MRTFVGKWNNSSRYSTVRQHLLDTGSVMRYLLKRNVTEQTVRASGLSKTEFEKLAVYCAHIHDIGKCTAAFQYKTPWGATELGKERFSPEYAEYSPHALAGAAIQNIVFGVPEPVCDITAAHHGTTRPRGKDKKYTTQMNKYIQNYYPSDHAEEYIAEWEWIYKEAIKESGIEKWPDVCIDAQILITGLVIMADWLASNEEYFPLGETSNQGVRCENAYKKIDLPDIWSPLDTHLPEDAFSGRFGFRPNILQKTVLQIAEMQSGPGLMIIESTMGTGKTEAALAAAEILSSHSGAGGIYFGLPTQATANGMLPRFARWADHVSGGIRTSFRLAHGNARMNEFYKKYPISDSKGITINQWLSGKHRALLSDFVVGTVDQLLLSSVRQKFFMLLHYGMSGKTVIIDEVHAYDTYMKSYMENVLAWLSSYGVPVILLSATLTQESRNALVKAYTGKELCSNAQDYPCVIWASRTGNFISPVHFSSRDKKINIQKVHRRQIARDVIEDIRDGGCAGIITNYVSDAQQIASELKDLVPADYKVILLHSRYLPAHREELEKQIVQAVGKNSRSADRNKVIVVGTQVLEQSLDIDFDVLYTEICPIDMLLQRIGRLHRHEFHDSDRPDMLKEPVCKVYETQGKDFMIYSPYILRRTRDVLPGSVHIPSDIRPLIERVYDLEQGATGADKTEYENAIRSKKCHAEDFMLPYPWECSEFKDMNAKTGDIEGVRDDMNTMRILLLVKRKNGSFACFDGRPIPDAPGPDDKALIAEQRLSIHYDDRIVQCLQSQELPSWASEYNEAFLIVDEQGNADFGKIRFNYSKYYGLRRF